MKLLVTVCPGWPDPRSDDGRVWHRDTILIKAEPTDNLAVDTLSHGACKDCHDLMMGPVNDPTGICKQERQDGDKRRPSTTNDTGSNI